MSTTHVNRDDVERRLDRLREEYGEFAVVECDELVPGERFDRLHEHAREGYTGGGYAWIVRGPDDAPALADSMPADAHEAGPVVCMILSRGDDDRWGIPGGGRETGETYEAATIREVREEVGLEVELGSPFLAYRATHEPDDGRAVRLHTLWVCFDAGYASGHLEILPGELRGAAWLAEPPRSLGPFGQFRGTEWWDDYEPAEPWWENPEPNPYDPGN